MNHRIIYSQSIEMVCEKSSASECSSAQECSLDANYALSERSACGGELRCGITHSFSSFRVSSNDSPIGVELKDHHRHVVSPNLPIRVEC